MKDWDLDRAIRWSTVAAVALLAAIAGWVSYIHAHEVVLAHGQHGLVAYAYPLTVDGMIYTASMVKLDAARRKIAAPGLAGVVLWLGIIVTGAVNIWAGWQSGRTTAVIYAWPALALVLGYELLMRLIRNTAVATETVKATVPETAAPVRAAAFGGVGSTTRKNENSQKQETLPKELADKIRDKQVPGVREIMRALGVGYNKAVEHRKAFQAIIDGKAAA